MSDLVSSVGSFFSQYAKPLSALATTAGAGANVYTGIQNANNLGNYNSTQQYIQNLVKNPQKMQAAAASYTQPLTAGLTDSVTNQVQAQLAERGLGGSPAALSSDITQALAPYIQQNQQTGLNTLLQSLGVAGAAKPATLPSVNLSQLMALLKQGGSGGTSDPSASMAQTGFADLQTPPSLSLDNSVPIEDYAAAA
jgi:hypothetical protein